MISFIKKKNPIHNQKDNTLMDILNENNVPVASSCGGEGVCAKCLITIHQGWENLSPLCQRELSLRQQHSFPENTRVSCQTYLTGDVTIDADYW